MNTWIGNARWTSGWRGIGMVAATWIYFLLHAQFGFLKRLSELGISGGQLLPVMGAMATGGAGASLLAYKLGYRHPPAWRLKVGFTACACAALLALLPLNLPAAMAVAAMTGVALGWVTVTLVSHLAIFIGNSEPLLKVGVGVGTAYFVSNCPPLFGATTQVLSLFAAGCCAVAACFASPIDSAIGTGLLQSITRDPLGFRSTLICFTALIGLDSAVFFIIQNTPAIKSATWGSPSHLWSIGGLHGIAALGSGWLLGRGSRGMVTTLALGFACLAGACLMLAGFVQPFVAACLYATGVSLYSTALIAYPGYLACSANPSDRSRNAGHLYAVAGWLGSGVGIGLAQYLHGIPPGLVAGLGLLFSVGLFARPGDSIRQ